MKRMRPLGPEVLFRRATGFKAAEKLTVRRARLYRLRKNSCFVSGHDFSRAVNMKRMRSSGPEVLFRRATGSKAAEKLTVRRARLYRLRKNSCFVSGHDFSRAVNMKRMRPLGPEVLFRRATGFKAAEKLTVRRARLYRLRKNSCFVSGHDFSRAVNMGTDRASR